jgi:hypothetical protein
MPHHTIAKIASRPGARSVPTANVTDFSEHTGASATKPPRCRIIAAFPRMASVDTRKSSNTRDRGRIRWLSPPSTEFSSHCWCRHRDGPLPAYDINRRPDRNSFLAGDNDHLLFRKPDASISLQYRWQHGRRNEDAQSAKREISNFRNSRRNIAALPSRVHTFSLVRFGLPAVIRKYCRHPMFCPRRSWRGQTPALAGQESRAESQV